MLTENDLQLADILLSTGDAAVSSVIRFGTGSRFSHAALYAGNGEIIEAIGEGVVRQSLSRAMRDDTLVCVYRRIGMSSAQAGQIIRYATMQIGKPYDQLGAAGAGVTSGRGAVLSVFAGMINPIAAMGVEVAAAGNLINRLNPERSFYCSELVALAFENAGLPLGGRGASTTPQDVASAHVLNLIGVLKGE